MNHWKPLFLAAMAVLLLLSAAGCQNGSVSANETQQTADAPIGIEQPTNTSVEQVVVSVEASVTQTPTAAPTDTPAPTEAPTPEPTATPTPFVTRAPIEGDIAAVHFPDYDTGTDADWSYQSDELRIAIRKTVDDDLMQVYYVADVWVRNRSAFRTGFGNGKFNSGTEDGEKFAQREHAILAVNGSMNRGLIIHNGEKRIRGIVNDESAIRAVCFLYMDGTMKVYNLDKDRVNLKNEEKKGILHAWQFGPALVQNGEIAQKFPTYGTRHPRIMLGYYEPGHYAVVAVDGRSKTAVGMNNGEMAELMKNLGCVEAMNLDGGTSAMMVFMGKCISNPSGVDKDGDGKAGRNLKDMLLFAEYDAEGSAPALEDVDQAKLRLPQD